MERYGSMMGELLATPFPEVACVHQGQYTDFDAKRFECVHKQTPFQPLEENKNENLILNQC
jgi:hypothetical protein